MNKLEKHNQCMNESIIKYTFCDPYEENCKITIN